MLFYFTAFYVLLLSSGQFFIQHKLFLLPVCFLLFLKRFSWRIKKSILLNNLSKAIFYAKKNEKNVFNVVCFLVQKQRDSHNEKGLKIYESVFLFYVVLLLYDFFMLQCPGKNVVLVKKCDCFFLFRSIWSERREKSLHAFVVYTSHLCFPQQHPHGISCLLKINK